MFNCYNVIMFSDVIEIETFGCESSNNGEFWPEGTWKLFRIKEIIVL